MHFGVQVSGTPGTYFNSAGGSADAVAVAGVENAVGVTVTGTTPPVDDPAVVPSVSDPSIASVVTVLPVVVADPVAVVEPVRAAPTGKVVATTYSGATLAYTGADVLLLIELGGLMLALGFAMVGLGRRRSGR